MIHLQKIDKYYDSKFQRTFVLKGNQNSQPMRTICLIALLLVLLFFGSSCHPNKLKNNEKTLVKQILTEEEQLAHLEQIRMEKEKLLTDSLAKLPKGFRFKEDRSVDPQTPPVVIDKGELMISLKGSDLKSQVKSVRFKKSSAPAEKKEKLKQLAVSVADQDDVLMIVK